MKVKPITRGGRVIAFIEKYCHVPDGMRVGQKIVLEPFQKAFILDVYDNPKGTRRGILSIARKNGKTALIACLLLAHLVGPEAVQNAQIVCGARSRDQAAIVFDLACKIVNASPDLRGRVAVTPSSKKLTGIKLNVTFKALAAEAKTSHGQSPVLVILDELGQVSGPTDEFVSALTTAQGAHANPLILVISTQAPTDADLLSIWIDDAISGADPHTVCHLHAAPQDAAIDDEKGWLAANPAMNSFRSLKDIRTQAETAMRLPSEEASFRNLILNQRVTVFNPFVTRSVWQGNGGAVEDDAFGGPVYVGLDLSQTTDLTAMVVIGKKADVWHVRPYFWLPGQLVAERARKDRVPYVDWQKAGYLRATPGASVDYVWLAGEIAAILDGLDVRAFAFDRYNMNLVKPHIEAAGGKFPFVDWGQGWVSMSPAVQALEVELLEGRVRHGNHPVLTMCASNTVIWKDPAGNRKLDKAKSSGRIDGMVALVMAMGAAVKQAAEAAVPVLVSPWDDPKFSIASMMTA